MISALEVDLMIVREVIKVVQLGHAKETNSIRFVSLPWLKSKAYRSRRLWRSSCPSHQAHQAGEKLHVGYAARFIEPIVLAKSGWFAISPAGAPEFTSNWKFGPFCAGGAAL